MLINDLLLMIKSNDFILIFFDKFLISFVSGQRTSYLSSTKGGCEGLIQGPMKAIEYYLINTQGSIIVPIYLWYIDNNSR